jgi:hypothetical protein
MPRGQARRRSAAEEDGKKKRRRGFAVEGGRRRNRKKTPFSNRQFHPIFRLALRPIIDPKWKTAHHTRRQHCYWLVFRKSKKCE